MPAAGLARHVTHPSALAARPDQSPHLRPRCGPLCGIRPTARPATRAAPGRDLICFMRAHRPGIVEGSGTLSSVKSVVSTRRLRSRCPYGPYAFHAGQTGPGFYRTPRTYPRWPPRAGEACAPFSPPSPKAAHTDADSIIAELIAGDVIREDDISRPPPRTTGGHVHVAFTPGLTRHAFPARKRFKVFEGSV